MISAVAVETRRRPTEQELITAIKRNFGGLEGLDPVQEFGKFLPFILRDMVMHLYDDKIFVISYNLLMDMIMPLYKTCTYTVLNKINN